MNRLVNTFKQNYKPNRLSSYRLGMIDANARAIFGIRDKKNPTYRSWTKPLYRKLYGPAMVERAAPMYNDLPRHKFDMKYQYKMLKGEEKRTSGKFLKQQAKNKEGKKGKKGYLVTQLQ